MSHPSPSHRSPIGRRSSRPSLVPAVLGAALVAALLAGCTSDPEPSTTSTRPATTAEQAAACRPDDLPKPISAKAVARADTDGTTLQLVTHDSFATSEGIFDEFTAETGITVELLSSGDAGQVVSQAVLTAGRPVADVLFGVDTTFLCRATKAGVFVPYAPAALADVPKALRQEPDDLATPIDVGDVCLNYATDAYPTAADAPQDLDDLAKPAFADAFVTEDPETSSPGFAFLLATISRYGEDGWQRYWKDLRANGVEVEAGWEEAYEGSFDSGSGDGDRSIVTSYATSPVADVVYADPPRTTPAIGVVADSCFRQVEFAGVLRGTDHPEAAAKLVDFLLSKRFQEDIPLNMFVEPANTTAEVPAVFEANRTEVTDPLTLTPAEIEAGRDGWTRAWTDIVLR